MSTITPRGAETIRTDWRPLAVAGAAVALLGLAAIVLPFGTGIALAYVVGAALFVGGFVHGSHAITTDGWAGSLWQALVAALSILAGAMILVNPVVGLVSLTLVAIAYLFADGVAELWTSVRMGPGTGRGWIAASGVLSLALGGLLWAGFPVDALWLVGVVVGVSLLTTGLSMIAIAYGVRGIDSAGSEPAFETRST